LPEELLPEELLPEELLPEEPDDVLPGEPLLALLAVVTGAAPPPPPEHAVSVRKQIARRQTEDARRAAFLIDVSMTFPVVVQVHGNSPAPCPKFRDATFGIA
jgi:hypothetical protein